MTWTLLDTWIVAAGGLSALSCALLGNFLVLRRMSLMGDAISHAVLPGLAAAFILTGSRASLIMLAGAAAVGLLTALLTQWLHTLGRVEQGASMGVVFTVLFALGLILMVRGAHAVDIDPGCVLYGAVELVPMNTFRLGEWRIPVAVGALSGVFAVNAAFVILFYKELKLSSFDPDLATTLGFNAGLMHYLLMGLVAVTTVASFESVGSILVIAMLIVPGAAAHLLTDRLPVMILLSLAIAALSAFLGHVSAITVPPLLGFRDTTTAGMIAVVAGLIFFLALLLAPRHGVLSKLAAQGLLSQQILREDLLGLLFRVEELGQPGARSALIEGALDAGRWRCALAARSLLRRGEIEREGEVFRLAPAGREAARHLVRSHRLWEAYLHRHSGVAADHLHDSAARLEHVTDSALQRRLAREADLPARDPQGKRIPSVPEPSV